MTCSNWMRSAAAAALLLISHPALLACTACFGQSDSKMAQGMNMGIFVLLLVITSVLCGVASFFVFLSRRAAQTQPGQSQFAANPSANQPTLNQT